MNTLLSAFLDKPVILQDQAVIQISGYDMDYFEYLCGDWQVLIYRSHKNPVITKVIMVNKKQEFNYAIAQDNICCSHFLEYYQSLDTISDKQMSLITGKLEEVSYYLRIQALGYQDNVRFINILPPELKQAMRDYELLNNLVNKNLKRPVVKLFLELNINVQSEYEFLQELADAHKMRI